MKLFKRIQTDKHEEPPQSMEGLKARIEAMQIHRSEIGLSELFSEFSEGDLPSISQLTDTLKPNIGESPDSQTRPEVLPQDLGGAFGEEEAHKFRELAMTSESNGRNDVEGSLEENRLQGEKLEHLVKLLGPNSGEIPLAQTG